MYAAKGYNACDWLLLFRIAYKQGLHQNCIPIHLIPIGSAVSKSYTAEIYPLYLLDKVIGPSDPHLSSRVPQINNSLRLKFGVVFYNAIHQQD